MYAFLLTVLVLDGIFLGIVILLQSGKGGGLAAVGGGAAMTEGLLGGRQATTVLTRATWAAGTTFMVLSLVLSILSSRAQQPESVIQVQAPATAPSSAPQPILPGGTTETPATGAETAPTNPGDPGS
ncbi:MAG TPA: preprotein translocase subunit SecG [Longimicrobiales bacterium]|nr:preprotein translocase subunit SecG [Longimicrobiales bacterium]